MAEERSYLRERVSTSLSGARRVPSGSQSEAGTVSFLQQRVDQALKGDPEAKVKYSALRDRVRDRLLKEVDAGVLFQPHDRTYQIKMADNIKSILDRFEPEIPASARWAYVERLSQDLVGYGPVQPLIDDESVSEVMINAFDDIWVERSGRLEKVADDRFKFESDDAVRDLAERIALPLRRRIDERNPILDARLADGSRVCATLSPPALNGCAISIRKFNQGLMGLEGLRKIGTLTDDVVAFLQQCVVARASTLVVGGTSSGKTTVLNVLSSFIPADERIITIEDAAELQLQQPHVLRYETRGGNAEGKGAITIRDLVRTSLRLRPDRIVVGEVRGGEALDMIQANNTGHDGGFSTIHANSTRDGLSRLETLVLMADSGLPLLAIRQQIASAFEVLIGCVRLRNGRRRISEIAEIEGVTGGEYSLRTLWRYNLTTDCLEPTGETPLRLSQRFLWSTRGEG